MFRDGALVPASQNADSSYCFVCGVSDKSTFVQCSVWRKCTHGNWYFDWCSATGTHGDTVCRACYCTIETGAYQASISPCDDSNTPHAITRTSHTASHAISYDARFVNSGTLPPGRIVAVPGTSRDFPVDGVPVTGTVSEYPTRRAPQPEGAFILPDPISKQTQNRVTHYEMATQAKTCFMFFNFGRACTVRLSFVSRVCCAYS